MTPHRIRKAILLLLLSGLALATGCSRSPDTAKAARIGAPVPVTIATVTQKTVPLEVRGIGNVEPYSTVSVKSQVTGELVRVHFQEGQEVKRGEPLFTIDPRPFEAAVRQAEANLAQQISNSRLAEANLARDIAQAKNAQVEAERYAGLVKQGIVAQEQYDRFRTSADAAEAVVRADRAAIQSVESAASASRAALENARLQLGYCSIVSPIDGRTGSLMVHQGNQVKANDTPVLVVIHQIRPIYVNFAVPEQHLPEIKKHMATGRLSVQAVIPQDEQHPVQGALTFVDNAVDATTGTIKLKATFPNEEKRLWPGQFVNALLVLSAQPNAVVVPSQAVQMGQAGQYVFVVKPDFTVESRTVTVGLAYRGETVIEKGLQPGEKVVTDGQLRLVPGAKVEVRGETGKEARS